MDDAGTVTALRIWHCKYPSLAGLPEYTDLSILVVATYPDADLEPVASLSRLEYLRILHLPRVRSLAPLSRLTSLRTVRLETLPSWDASGKTTTVESLKPLELLPYLTHVELFGILPEDRSLRALESAPRLASVRVSKYPQDEVQRFYTTTGLSDAWAPEPGIADWS